MYNVDIKYEIFKSCSEERESEELCLHTLTLKTLN